MTMKSVAILLLLCLSWAENLEEETPGKPAPEQQTKKNNATSEVTVTKEIETKQNNQTAAEESKCSSVSNTLGTSGIPQTCTVHSDCRGAFCETNLLAHNISYNFTVMPCHKPTVDLTFNITDLTDASIKQIINSSEQLEIPGGNMSYQGWYETLSSVNVVLETVLDITHFRLDFGVQYKVLQDEELRQLFSHTLVPTLSVMYSEELCEKPVEAVGEKGEDDKYFGVIPKEYVKDKKTLALIATSATLAVIVVIVGIYCIISKRRNSDNFYRTYVSTDENRHLTKGNDGFEPLDDSDID